MDAELITLGFLNIALFAFIIAMIVDDRREKKEKAWNAKYGNTDFTNPYKKG